MLSLDCLRWRADVPAQQSAEREEGLSSLRARPAGWRPAPGEILRAGPGHGPGQAQQEGPHLGPGGGSGGSQLSWQTAGDYEVAALHSPSALSVLLSPPRVSQLNLYFQK